MEGPLNADKVARLSEQLSSGNLEFDSKQIAARMLTTYLVFSLDWL